MVGNVFIYVFNTIVSRLHKVEALRVCYATA